MVATVADLVPYAAKAFGDAEAVRFLDDGVMSFAEVERLTARFAGTLAAAGIMPGDRVILYLPNCCQWIIAYHAIARVAAVAIPINILLSRDEIAFIASDAAAKLAILAPEHVERLPAGMKIVTLGHAGGCSFDDLEDRFSNPQVQARSEDLFSICYTSGTTGRPKGAMLTHGNIMGSINMTATMHVRMKHDRIYSALPFSHVYGNVVLNAGFRTGSRLVGAARFDAGQALRAIAEHQITLFEGVPTMYYQMLVHPALPTTDFSSLTRCTVGGQTMPLDKLETIAETLGCPLLELWGMTELAGPAITHSPYWPRRHGSIGLPFPGMEVRIADLEDSDREAAPGEAGELLVRGALTTAGYWNNPEATAKAFYSGGWFATGDIARADADGYVTIVDRRKDMILCGGYNIYPAEVERAISEHPAVASVAVAGCADDEKGEIPVAHVVLRPEATSTDVSELTEHCRARLATYKLPRRIYITDSLPVTSTGKVMRRALSGRADRG